MLRRFSLLISSAYLATAVAGCSQPAFYGNPCPGPVMFGPQLLYPIPGATGVSSAAGYLVFATSASPTDFKPSLVSVTGTVVPVGALDAPPAPLPSPNATPSPLAKLYGASHPALAPNTTYNVEFAAEGSGPCPTYVEPSGSFTTR